MFAGGLCRNAECDDWVFIAFQIVYVELLERLLFLGIAERILKHVAELGFSRNKN
jgi:hypothetical protein